MYGQASHIASKRFPLQYSTLQARKSNKVQIFLFFFLHYYTNPSPKPRKEINQ